MSENEKKEAVFNFKIWTTAHLHTLVWNKITRLKGARHPLLHGRGDLNRFVLHYLEWFGNDPGDSALPEAAPKPDPRAADLEPLRWILEHGTAEDRATARTVLKGLGDAIRARTPIRKQAGR